MSNSGINDPCFEFEHKSGKFIYDEIKSMFSEKIKDLDSYIDRYLDESSP